MLEFNVSVRFPAASLFTVILALCGEFVQNFIINRFTFSWANLLSIHSHRLKVVVNINK